MMNDFNCAKIGHIVNMDEKKVGNSTKCSKNGVRGNKVSEYA